MLMAVKSMYNMEQKTKRSPESYNLILKSVQEVHTKFEWFGMYGAYPPWSVIIKSLCLLQLSVILVWQALLIEKLSID